MLSYIATESVKSSFPMGSKLELTLCGWDEGEPTLRVGELEN